jgi:hypothetical protein
MKIANEKTSVQKGRDGWVGNTDLSIENGCDYKITTTKFGSGVVKCYAQSGTFGETEHFTSFSFMMFSDPSYTLVQTRTRATSKTIAEIHAAGLQIFKDKLAAGEIATKVASV